MFEGLNNEKKDNRRLIIGIVFVVLSVTGLLFVIINNFQRILPAVTDLLRWHSLFRFIWVLIWCFFGLGLAAISASHNTDPDGAKFYSTYIMYIILLILASSIIFLYFSPFEDYPRLLFYFNTALISLFVGRNIDYIGSFILSLVKSLLG